MKPKWVVSFFQRKCSHEKRASLPPAYVVRGKVMFWHASVHPSICLSTGGGYPYPIMLCNISQNAMRQRGGTWVRYPPRGGTRVRYPPGGGTRSGTPPGGYPAPRGGTWVRHPPGGYPVRYPPPPGGTRPPGGYPGQGPPGGTQSGTPPGGTQTLGGTRSGTPQGVPGPPGGTRVRYPPRRGGGGYPGRTTEGVLTTRRAVCLLRSRRRTFLLELIFGTWTKQCLDVYFSI